MRQIPVDTSAATVMVAKTPQPKVRDRRTGEIATDAETGAKLMTVDVMFAANDEVEILSVTVPETGISGDLTMGTPAAPRGWSPGRGRTSSTARGGTASPSARSPSPRWPPRARARRRPEP
ncbi:hypothetical protein SUDANB140_03754 [Streptomyces sp. enrichment culture]